MASHLFALHMIFVGFLRGERWSLHARKPRGKPQCLRALGTDNGWLLHTHIYMMYIHMICINMIYTYIYIKDDHPNHLLETTNHYITDSDSQQMKSSKTAPTAVCGTSRPSHTTKFRGKKNLSGGTLMQNFNGSCLTSYLPRAALLQKKCKKLQTCTIFCCWTPIIDFSIFAGVHNHHLFKPTPLLHFLFVPDAIDTTSQTIRVFWPNKWFVSAKQTWNFWKPNPPTKIRKKNTVASFHGRVTLEIKLKRIIWVFPKIVVPPNHPF